MNISIKLIDQYMAIFFNFSPTSNHLHPLQIGNCDSNSRLVVDEDDYGKFGLERVNRLTVAHTGIILHPSILISQFLTLILYCYRHYI